MTMKMKLIYPAWPKLARQTTFHLPPHGPVVFAATVPAEVDLVIGGVEGGVRVRLVVIDLKGSEVFEFSFPQDAPRIDISSAETVHALDDQPASDHLFGRSVAVTRQDIHIAAASEPEDSQG